MSRYVLDDARALELLQDYSMYSDFPEQPGEVCVLQSGIGAVCVLSSRLSCLVKFKAVCMLEQRMKAWGPAMYSCHANVVACQRANRPFPIVHTRQFVGGQALFSYLPVGRLVSPHRDIKAHPCTQQHAL